MTDKLCKPPKNYHRSLNGRRRAVSSGKLAYNNMFSVTIYIKYIHMKYQITKYRTEACIRKGKWGWGSYLCWLKLSKATRLTDE